MKYFLGLAALLAAGIAVSAGYYGFERLMIRAELKTSVAACDTDPQATPQEKWLKERTCALVEQENEQLKQIAKASKSRKEFLQKKEALLEKWAEEDALGQLIREYSARKLQNKRD